MKTYHLLKKSQEDTIFLKKFPEHTIIRGKSHGSTVLPNLLSVTYKMEQSSYSVFQGFRQAKSANGGSILSSRQFLILPQLPKKMKFASKVFKVDSKIIISIPKI